MLEERERERREEGRRENGGEARETEKDLNERKKLQFTAFLTGYKN